ncbi:MAG TPA: hypothetical protein VD999_00645 [Vitreimonas sp.]|nr:hypothetical protein [Vitreimonas sp.]
MIDPCTDTRDVDGGCNGCMRGCSRLSNIDNSYCGSCERADTSCDGWSEWGYNGNVGACSASCGGGIQTRNCWGAVDSRSCNTHSCCTTICNAPLCGQANTGTCGGFCPSTSIGQGCSPQCGQPDVCNVACGNSDNGNPSAPTLTPANGGTTPVSGATASISWTAVGLADQYELELYPENGSCSSTGAVCTTVVGTSYNFTPTAGVSRYTWRVRGVNTTCGAFGGNDAGTWATASTFTVTSTITGTFYSDNNDNAQLSGSFCTLGSLTAISPGTGASIAAVGQDGGTYNGSIVGSNFTITVPWWNTSGANNIVTLTPGTNAGVAYACSCPNGCQYSGVAAPQAGVPYFILPENLLARGWWQVVGGSTYAADSTGTALSSQIPYDTTCNSGANCTRALITNDSDGTANSAGVALTGGGTIDTSRDTGNQLTYISVRDPQLSVLGTVTTRFQEGYDYFYRQLSLGLNPSDDFAASYTDAHKPSSAPNDGKNAYFRNGDLTVKSQWTVTAGEQYVIFVNGNLTLGDGNNNIERLINIEEGGFVAFIVSGNITVEPGVGNTSLTDTAANIEGIYMADGTFTVRSRGESAGGDNRFVGAGSFVGWSGVSLERDFSDGSTRKQENNTKAVEMFVYRPDLVRYVPEELARPRYVWQETN